MMENEISQTPLGRIASAQDIANTVAFFASDVSGTIVGETISVAAGRK